MTVFNFPSACGFVLGKGEYAISSNGLSNAIYSSNWMVILLPVKLVVESAGDAPTMSGGRESLGPPVGGIGWPQLLPEIIHILNAIKKERDANTFMEANLKL